MRKIYKVGSVCSGIEAASVAWEPLGFEFEWFSEIAEFPSSVLKIKYPTKQNLGDMTTLPEKLLSNEILAPDLICGGTPCQAFSLAGLKNGLEDERGNLTLKFVDIIEANDKVRLNNSLDKTVVFWENVEGVLTDKTNAFGCFVSYLAGLEEAIEIKKWPSAGIIHGPSRNIAWRVLDAKFFGLPQQRKRLYVMAGDTSFYPENVLFEINEHPLAEYPKSSLKFVKDGIRFEIFREYTDCLYSAYGTKWNGNAAAYNGSLFVVQNDEIRRLSPLECERLMGFPDNYTDIPKARKTNRYKATGNSWAVPVISWLGFRLKNYEENFKIQKDSISLIGRTLNIRNGYFIDMGKVLVDIDEKTTLNCSTVPEECKFTEFKDIVDTQPPNDIFLSPVGCYGIVRRKEERNLKINKRLEEILLNISNKMSPEDIEKRSRVQKRGRYSEVKETTETTKKAVPEGFLFDLDYF